uniref:Uncharacterized protein n=1 Tax=Cucumis melo TaxID=3656 RepID=A0A9I9CKS2_CUCME
MDSLPLEIFAGLESVGNKGDADRGVRTIDDQACGNVRGARMPDDQPCENDRRPGAWVVE